ncbi:MAG TPA: SDR family oxidoreductase [Thermoanaerobaculia bacterium]|nr:SDR family oxidoreductase [Thermoanaerobaculia bacterium]
MTALAGKVAIVTGGSGGIGRAIIAALREAGATALSLDIGNADVNCDIRDDAAVARAVAEVEEKYERVDVAIHAAGIARDGVVWKLAVDEWDAVQQVNLRGAFLLARHVIPSMRRAGGGRIIFIGSINGSRGKVGTAAYSASKAGLLGLMKSVARETGRFGICVNTIEPGWVRTPMTEKAASPIKEAALAETLLGELVEPADVAAAVVFLAAAQRITGQTLRVDAGQYL